MSARRSWDNYTVFDNPSVSKLFSISSCSRHCTATAVSEKCDYLVETCGIDIAENGYAGRSSTFTD